jgi:hypothetical protein
MKFKFDIVYITSLILGFLYISGRSFLDGFVSTTGFTVAYFGFDFSDYTYYGFLSSYHHLLWLSIIIPIVYLAIKFIKNKHSYTPKIIFILKKLIHFTFNRKEYFDELKTRNLIAAQQFERKINASKESFSRHISISYYFMVISILIIFGVVLYWGDFLKRGQLEAHDQALTSISYVTNNQDKLFFVICGKERCLYRSKNLEMSLATKRFDVATKNLTFINTHNLSKPKNLFPAFILDKKEEKDKVLFIFQVQVPNDKERRSYTNNFKIKTKNGKYYLPVENDTAKRLTDLSSDRDLTIFLAFEIPNSETIESMLYQDKKSL